MKTPIFIKTVEAQPPAVDDYFTIAKNGLFLTKKMPFWRATVPVKSIDGLSEQATSLEVTLPPLSADLTQEIVNFLCWYTRQHYVESMLLLWARNDGKNITYRVEPPPQNVWPQQIEYQMPDRRNGELFLGTIHSHADMPAFHSQIDIRDHVGSGDGLHITFGNLGWGMNFSLVVNLIINGFNFSYNPILMLEGIEIKPEISRNKLLNSLVLGYDNPPNTYQLKNGKAPLPQGYKPSEDWQKQVKVNRSWFLKDGSPYPAVNPILAPPAKPGNES